MARFRYCFIDDYIIYAEYDGVRDIVFSTEKYIPLGILGASDSNKIELEFLFAENIREIKL